MKINNEPFIEGMMLLTEQSHRDRGYLELMLQDAGLSSTMRRTLEQINRTLVTYEEVVRELAEQQMDIEERFLKLLENSEGEDREENPPSSET